MQLASIRGVSNNWGALFAYRWQGGALNLRAIIREPQVLELRNVRRNLCRRPNASHQKQHQVLPLRSRRKVSALRGEASGDNAVVPLHRPLLA